MAKKFLPRRHEEHEDLKGCLMAYNFQPSYRPLR